MDIETGLDNLLRGQFDAALAEFEGCGQQPTAEKLCELTRACADLSAYAAALAEGICLSARPNPAVTFPRTLKACTPSSSVWRGNCSYSARGTPCLRLTIWVTSLTD